ncbi:MAG: TrkH family potassium uptake protein [Phycisphaerales bacterium JB043]
MARQTYHLRRPSGAPEIRHELIRSLLVMVAFAPVVMHFGWRQPLVSTTLSWLIVAPLLVLYAFVTIRRTRITRGAIRAALGEHRVTLLLVVLGVALAWLEPVLAFVPTLLVLTQLLRLFLLVVQTSIPSGLVFVGSFVLLILVGTLGLLLPAATPPDQPINVLDAAFTITSAISQTGLVVRGTGEGFTRFGQVIILIWIQVGALGVIVFGSLLATMLGSSFSLRATQTIADQTEQGWATTLSLHKLVVFIIIVTHSLELLGAIALYVAWPEQWLGSPDMASVGDRIYHCVFFSVSAFCNAGFVTTSNSLEGLRAHFSSHAIIVPLILLGSIGFPVLDNIWRVVWSRLRGVRKSHGGLIRLNLNTKIVLITTLCVYVLGYLFILIGEMTQTAEPESLILLDAHFMTINRTSGFDTIAPDSMGLLSKLVIIFLMFIGGSPGSVAGGIKIMVFAVLVLTVWSTILGRDEVRAFKRTIPQALVKKSATLIVLFLIGIMATTGVLAATMPTAPGAAGSFTLDSLLFEATSAFATVGYSVGVTPETPAPARAALMVAMFFGRVGPLAVLAALLGLTQRRTPRIEYPTEDVVVY